MTVQEIRELISLVVESGIAELEVQRGENKVRVRRTAAMSQEILLPAAMPTQTLMASPMPMPAATAGVAVPAAPAVSFAPPAGPVGAAAPQAAAAPEVDADAVVVKSPIVGTYYESPSPGAAPFVKVGDTVQPGQVLCIIESMKLMNEIEAEQAGVVLSKLVTNGRPVEYGEGLFALKPL